MTYNSSFQDRAGQAAEAKQKALEQYRARPPVDEKLAAERKAAGEERAAAKARKRPRRKPNARPRRGLARRMKRPRRRRAAPKTRGRAQGGAGCKRYASEAEPRSSAVPLRVVPIKVVL